MSSTIKLLFDALVLRKNYILKTLVQRKKLIRATKYFLGN